MQTGKETKDLMDYFAEIFPLKHIGHIQRNGNVSKTKCLCLGHAHLNGHFTLTLPRSICGFH